MSLRLSGAVALSLLLLCPSAFAQSTPDVPVNWAGYTWNRDRYEPDEFQPIGSYQGRSDVLRILIGPDGIASNRDPGFGSGFYDTQGRSATVNLPAGAFGTADFYIPKAWQAQQSSEWQATGLWGSTFKPTGPGTETVIGYPIIAFANSAQLYGNAYGSAGAQGGRIMVYDDDTDAWNVVSSDIKYDGWNTLRFEIHKDRYEFYFNGKLVFTDYNIDTDPQAYLKKLFINSKNNNQVDGDYDVFISNLLAGALKDSTVFEIVGSVPGMTEYYTYSTIGDLATRRGQEATEHFSPYNYAWVYGGGTTGSFDASGTSGYDGTTYFMRGGIDIIQPMEALRFGVTGSTGHARTSSDATGGSAEADNFSVGAYATYATPELYVDAIAEYAWGNWKVNVPSEGSASPDVSSFVGSAEIGTHVSVARGLRLVPNASLLYINSDYDEISFDSVSVAFDSSNALIGRAGARLEYIISPAFGGSRAYVGASAVKDLIDGNAFAIASSPAFTGGNSVAFGSGVFQQTSVQFNGGLDLKIAKATRLYGDVSYVTGGDADAFRGSGGVSINW